MSNQQAQAQQPQAAQAQAQASVAQALAKNVTYLRRGNIVTISFDMTQNLGKSKSGKNDLVATTHGFLPMPDGGRVSINVII